MERIPMTAAGFKALEDEVNQLKNVERHAIIKMIAEARAHGDLSENAEYHAAKERQAFIEGPRDGTRGQDRPRRGDRRVEAVGHDREVRRDGDAGRRGHRRRSASTRSSAISKPTPSSGRISISSPIARALIGKGKGDTVEVAAPGGARSYEILKVEFV